MAYMMQGRFDEAVNALEHSHALFGDFATALFDMVACYTALGRIDDAMAAADKLCARQPALTVALFRATTPHQCVPYIDRIIKSLRATGFPET
ncbi:MAG: tetratricopeptide repeat protein [Proteobacteria bacterium]|nr:tetratricopeptide repeat protein [Pseudomonadota bacterium]MDA1286327.1 tetratricopeptide repeat protein [Pseudomonadota bacterium]